MIVTQPLLVLSDRTYRKTAEGFHLPRRWFFCSQGMPRKVLFFGKDHPNAGESEPAERGPHYDWMKNRSALRVRDRNLDRPYWLLLVYACDSECLCDNSIVRSGFCLMCQRGEPTATVRVGMFFGLSYLEQEYEYEKLLRHCEVENATREQIIQVKLELEKLRSNDQLHTTSLKSGEITSWKKLTISLSTFTSTAFLKQI